MIALLASASLAGRSIYQPGNRPETDPITVKHVERELGEGQRPEDPCTLRPYPLDHPIKRGLGGCEHPHVRSILSRSDGFGDVVIEREEIVLKSEIE